MNRKNWNVFNLKKIVLLLLICLFCLWITSIMAGCSVIDPRPIHLNENTRQEVITSAVVGDTYPIYISLPLDYDANPGTYYDVVYLLDAEWYFSETQNLIYEHIRNNEMKPVILVSIGNNVQRARDYTPTNFNDSSFPNSGGAEKYGTFIKTELIPYIDSHYRTIANPENRCLAGHSLGGLFAYYALFFYNDTFHKIVAAGASLWWDDEIIFQYENDYSQSHISLPVTVYTSMTTGDSFDNIYQDTMVNRLRSRNYTGFAIYPDTFEGYSHVNGWRPAFDKELPLLFQK